MLKKLFYKIFKRYKRLELRFVSYREGDVLIRNTATRPENERWVLAKEEDMNHVIGMVYLERKERIIF